MLRRIFIAAFCVFLAYPSQAAKETVLKIASLAPDSTIWMQEFRDSAEQIKEATQGRVKIKFYPGGVMGTDQAVLRKIRIGQLHGGAVTVGALAKVYPDVQIYSMPLQFRSVAEVNYVRKQMDQLIRDNLRKHGFELLGMSNGGFAYFAGIQAGRSIDDFKKQRVWLPQGDLIGEAIFDAAGVSPVPLPLSDVYTSLQTGMLDTIVSNPSGIIAFQWHSKIRYLTDVPVVFLMGTIVVNSRAFNRIAETDQDIVREEMQSMFLRLDKLNDQDNANAYEALKKNGVEMISVSDEELKRWDQIALDSLQQLAEQGAYSKDFLELLQKHIKDFRDQNNKAAALVDQ